MRIGFIGLGRMGVGMAANLVASGQEVTVYNRSPGKAHGLVEKGARAVAQIAEACRGDAVLSMLSDDAAVEAVVFGEGGVLASLREGAIHVSLSTISVALSQRLAAAHATAGQAYVAAPVLGRPEAAAAAKLFIVAAGPPHAVETCSPLFEAIGQRTFHFGAQAHVANLIKLSGNFLIGSAIEALGEAMALVGKAEPTPVPGAPYLNAVQGTRLRDLRPTDRGPEVRARRVRCTAGIEGYPSRARGCGDPGHTHATWKPAARSLDGANCRRR